MKPFEESDRYNVDLTPDSVVMDVGGYEGNFANQIHLKYGCRVEVYEPVTDFYNQMVARFAEHPKIRLWPYGLGGSNRQEMIGVKGDMSGIFCTSPNYREPIAIRDVAEVIGNFPSVMIGLMKLNCEGAEYEILDRLIETDAIELVQNLSVQFHKLHNDSVARMKGFYKKLSRTHEMTYDEPFIWTGWKLRS